jgi:hypothetical protein
MLLLGLFRRYKPFWIIFWPYGPMALMSARVTAFCDFSLLYAFRDDMMDFMSQFRGVRCAMSVVWLSLMSAKRAAISAVFFTERASVQAPEMAVDCSVLPSKKKKKWVPPVSVKLVKVTNMNKHYCYCDGGHGIQAGFVYRYGYV